MSQNLINTTLIIIFLGIFKVLGVFIVFKYLFIWFQAYIFGPRISIFYIFKMGLRKIPPKIIVNALIMAHKAGLKNILLSDLENHHLAGGKITDVIKALIVANNANIPFDFKHALSLDLAGINVFDAVKTSINPKIIDYPSNNSFISTRAKDGVIIKIKVKITVKTILHKLAGSAQEETLLASISEAIMSSVSTFESHLIALESLQQISENALRKKINYPSCFEILSIDIYSLEIGEDISSKLKILNPEKNVTI
jgi:uncharacterized protein YqfA (UPF0365 family)